MKLREKAEIKKEAEAKDLFVATVVHDLKNPIHAQLSGLNLLANGTFGTITPQQKEIIDLITESVSFMNELIYSVLDIYKYENEPKTLRGMPFDLTVLIKKCINELKFSAEEKRLKLIFGNFTDNSVIKGDERAIRRTLTNLITNAIRYSDAGSEIKIDTYENNNDLIIKIKNIGATISNDIKHKIFDKYFSTAAGNGLGLYYCKKAVDAHGGKIFVNTDNNITEFVISLPY